MSELDFDKIVQEFRGSYHEGQLKFGSSSFSFKNKKTSKTEQIQNNDIENLYWLKRAKGNCFKVQLKNGNTYRFDGFGENDYDKLDDYASKYVKKSVEKKDLSVKGWNWGKTYFAGDTMNFEADGKLAFEIPLRNVSNTNTGKNEAILQFHQNEDAQISLMEIRFHVPSVPDSDIDPAQELVQNILAKADIQSASDADAICTLTELNCQTPRGRYDVKFFTDFIDLHGKTFDYKISYDHILRLFLLPHKDQRQMYFVVAMDPPMKQGNTRYPFLIVLFNIEDSITVELTLSDKTKEKFGDRLEKLDTTISGPYHEVVSRICRSILDKRITVPGNFTTAAGAKCFQCSCKANSGFLYPLERGFIFVTKPPLHVLFSDINIVKFDRSSQGTRSFDFEIEHKNGTKYVFNGIDKTEQAAFQDFIKNKGMKIAKSDDRSQSNLKSIGGDDHDPYAERMKAEGREKDDDDDDDDEDEDFEAGSESDDDIEYDSDASISDSNEEGDDDAGSGSGDSDDDEDEGKKKKRKSKEKKDSKKSSSSSKRKEKSSPKKKSKSSESSKSKSKAPAPAKEGSKAPKSAEFIEDSGSTDSD